MPATLAITLDDASHGGAPLSGEGRCLKERIKIVGTATAVADTGTYIMRWVRRNPRPIGWSGGFSYNPTTFVLTLTAQFALGSNTMYLDIVDDPGPP